MSDVVLIVDDEPNLVMALRIFLESEGFEVIEAKSAKNALELSVERQPDLILLDIMMPDMNGYELCAELRKNNRSKLIPVIFLTALNDPENLIKGFELGGDDFMTKPFENRELLARVKARIARSHAEREANPVTSLPGGSSAHREVNSVIQKGSPMTLIFIKVDGIAAFRKLFGSNQVDRLIKDTAVLISEALTQTTNAEDGVFHISEDEFLICIRPTKAGDLTKYILESFKEIRNKYYDPEHIEKGYIVNYGEDGRLQEHSLARLLIAALSNTRKFVSTYAGYAKWGESALLKAAMKDGDSVVLEE